MPLVVRHCVLAALLATALGAAPARALDSTPPPDVSPALGWDFAGQLDAGGGADAGVGGHLGFLLLGTAGSTLAAGVGGFAAFVAGYAVGAPLTFGLLLLVNYGLASLFDVPVSLGSAALASLVGTGAAFGLLLFANRSGSNVAAAGALGAGAIVAPLLTAVDPMGLAPGAGAGGEVPLVAFRF